VAGRIEKRDRETLVMLVSGEGRSFTMEIGVFYGSPAQ
jgi:hypothetical protein